jgi:hypothetical protein
MVPGVVIVAAGIVLWYLWSGKTVSQITSVTSKTTSDKALPHRRNNPGAILTSSQAWEGIDYSQVRVNGQVEYFVSYEYGARAQMKLFRNYVGNGYNTIRKIVTRWAGPGIKPVELSHYISHVSVKTGIAADALLKPEQAAVIGWAMHSFESGYEWVSLEEYLRVYNKYFK